MTIGLEAYLILGALLFAAGLIAVLSRRNAVAVLVGIELMLNAANVNLVAFDHFIGGFQGQVFALFVLVIAAAEAAVALAIIMNVFDATDRVNVDRIDSLKG